MFLPNVGTCQLKCRLSHPIDRNVIFTTLTVSVTCILCCFLEDTSKGEVACVIFRLTNCVTDCTEWSCSWEAAGCSLSRNSLHCVQPRSLFPCLQDRAICHYPVDPVHTLTAGFVHIGLNIVPFMPRSSSWFFPSSFSISFNTIWAGHVWTDTVVHMSLDFWVSFALTVDCNCSQLASCITYS